MVIVALDFHFILLTCKRNREIYGTAAEQREILGLIGKSANIAIIPAPSSIIRLPTEQSFLIPWIGIFRL